MNYTRCIEKSRFGAVTFDKRVVCSFMFNNLSKLKSGKECDGLHSLAELIFDGIIVCFYWLFNSEAFCVSSCVEDMNGLLDDCFGCHSKVFRCI